LNSNLLFVIRVSLVATIGGLLFGYDTAVIAGAIGFMKIHFGLSPAMVGWVASSALLGCVIGAFLAGYISDAIGRKAALMVSAILFFISALGTAFPETLSIFIFFRILGGVGVGMASMASPMYIAELSPAKYRGALVSLNQLAIIAGMLIVYFANYLIADYGAKADSLASILPESMDSWNVVKGWRYMFGSEALPALLLLVLLFFVPKSPQWLFAKGKVDEARRILFLVEGDDVGHREIEISNALKQQRVTLSELLKSGFKLSLMIAIGLAFFQQTTGINAVLYFAPEILKGVSKVDGNLALKQTIIIGGVNLLFTIVGVFSVDRLGRRRLLLMGYTGMGLALFFLGLNAMLGFQGVINLVLILAYIACFACSVGPITWVLLAEIFPAKIRGRAMSVATVFLWGSNFLVSQTFPVMNGNEYLIKEFNYGFPFLVYGVFCILALWFTWRMVPETKNKTLEEIQGMW
jgi:SP family xylose:H+ symportor-like MFS transporter